MLFDDPRAKSTTLGTLDVVNPSDEPIEGRDLESLILRAHYWAPRGEIRRSLGDARAAIALDETHPGAWAAIGTAYQFVAAIGPARDALERALALSGGQPAWRRFIVAHLAGPLHALGDHDRARGLIDDSDDRWSAFARARIAMLSGDTQQALAIFGALHDQAPTGRLALALAEARLAIGDMDAADATFAGVRPAARLMRVFNWQADAARSRIALRRGDDRTFHQRAARADVDAIAATIDAPAIRDALLSYAASSITP